jgi:hypothetical protein
MTGSKIKGQPWASGALATVRRIWIVRTAHSYKVSLTLPKVILLTIAPTSFQECAPKGEGKYMFFPKNVKLDIIRGVSQKDRRGSEQPPAEYLDDRSILEPLEA